MILSNSQRIFMYYLIYLNLEYMLSFLKLSRYDFQMLNSVSLVSIYVKYTRSHELRF